MKHIKKKFLFQKEITKDEMRELDLASTIIEHNSVKVIDQGIVPFLVTDKSIFIQSFIYSENGSQYYIPEPDQVLIYFNNAQANFKIIKEKKSILLKSLNPKEIVTEDLMNQIYGLFGITSGFVIFMFSSLEAFINQLIPEDFIYVKEIKNKRTERYSKDQIQRWIQFDEKLNMIIVQVTNKNFQKKYPLKAQHINNLKEFRNELIHPKHNPGINKYHYLSKRALKFKYEETIKAVKDFMNYLKPKYIEECDCGADH